MRSPASAPHGASHHHPRRSVGPTSLPLTGKLEERLKYLTKFDPHGTRGKLATYFSQVTGIKIPADPTPAPAADTKVDAATPKSANPDVPKDEKTVAKDEKDPAKDASKPAKKGS